MYRTLLGILAAFAAALLVVGFTFSAASEAPADYAFINGTEPKSLDPALITGQPEGRIADAIFEGLTRRNTASLQPEPGVATSWSLSDDKRTWTFRLRPGARWSDGRPVTAHDFAWSWRRMLEPALGAEYAYLLHLVRGAEAFNLYAANADAIVGPRAKETLLAGVQRLLATGAAVGQEAWQDFLSAGKAQEHLKGCSDPAVLDALSTRADPLPRAVLEALVPALEREGARRRAEHARAAERLGRDEGFYAADEHTFVVELVAPTPYFLELTCFYPLFAVPRWVVRPRDTGDVIADEDQDWFLPGTLVGNGPFVVESWRVNGKMRLARSSTYWGRERVRMRYVDIYPVDNVTTALNLYLTGEVDWLPGQYPLDVVQDLKKRPDFYAHAGLSTYFYRFNCTKPPFDDVRVRKALCLAVDRREIVEHITQRGEVPATRMVPPGLAGYEPPGSAITHDPEQARRLLAEAGYPGGQGFPAVSILHNTSEGHKKVAEYIADRLKRTLGIPVSAYNKEWQAYQDDMRLLKYEIARAGWIADYPDPNTFLDMWVTNGGNNQTGWSDALYDRLVTVCADVESFVRAGPEDVIARLKEPGTARELAAAVARAPDAASRAEAGVRLRAHLFREAEAILFQDAFPVMPLYYYVNTGLVRPWVREFYRELRLPDGSTAQNLQDLHPFHDVWVDAEARARAGVR